MRIGYIQCLPKLGDVNETINRLNPLVDKAASADLIVLPELCNSGYNFKSKKAAYDASETVGESKFIKFLEEKSRKHDLHIVSGFNEQADKKLYNSAIVIGPTGVVGKYRKLHLFLNEKDFFEPGNLGLPVFDLGICKIGVLICFDWHFPEAWRILALKNADIICHPSNLVLPGLAQKAIPVHALVNRVFIVTANRIGTEDNLSFTGLSIIASPKGDVILQGAKSGEEVGLVDIDVSMARDKMLTSKNHIYQDRRTEEYALLAN